MKNFLKILTFILAVGFVSTLTQIGMYQVANSNNGSVRGFSFDAVGDMFAFLRNGETIRMSGTYTPQTVGTPTAVSAITYSENTWFRIGNIVSARGRVNANVGGGIVNWSFSVPITTKTTLTSLRGNGQLCASSGNTGSADCYTISTTVTNGITLAANVLSSHEGASIWFYNYEYRVD